MKKIFFQILLMSISTVSFSQEVASTNTILNAAYKQAAKENKNVFIIFHASWCGWCKKLDASMNDESIKKYFDDNYIIAHLTVKENGEKKKLENEGADVLLTKYKGQQAGLPFFVITDKTRKFIGDSFAKEESIGCPSNKSEVEYFIALLKKSSKINAEGLDKIAARFRKNE